MYNYSNRNSEEHGVTVVLFTFILVGVFSVVALAIGVGGYVNTKSSIQEVAHLMSLAAFESYTRSVHSTSNLSVEDRRQLALDRARFILDNNPILNAEPAGALGFYTNSPGGAVAFGTYYKDEDPNHPNLKCPCFNQRNINNDPLVNSVQVNLKMRMKPAFFGGIFGSSGLDVSVSSTVSLVETIVAHVMDTSGSTFANFKGYQATCLFGSTDCDTALNTTGAQEPLRQITEPAPYVYGTDRYSRASLYAYASDEIFVGGVEQCSNLGAYSLADRDVTSYCNLPLELPLEVKTDCPECHARNEYILTRVGGYKDPANARDVLVYTGSHQGARVAPYRDFLQAVNTYVNILHAFPHSGSMGAAGFYTGDIQGWMPTKNGAMTASSDLLSVAQVTNLDLIGESDYTLNAQNYGSLNLGSGAEWPNIRDILGLATTGPAGGDSTFFMGTNMVQALWIAGQIVAGNGSPGAFKTVNHYGDGESTCVTGVAPGTPFSGSTHPLSLPHTNFPVMGSPFCQPMYGPDATPFKNFAYSLFILLGGQTQNNGEVGGLVQYYRDNDIQANMFYAGPAYWRAEKRPDATGSCGENDPMCYYLPNDPTLYEAFPGLGASIYKDSNTAWAGYTQMDEECTENNSINNFFDCRSLDITDPSNPVEIKGGWDEVAKWTKPDVVAGFEQAYEGRDVYFGLALNVMYTFAEATGGKMYLIMPPADATNYYDHDSDCGATTDCCARIASGEVVGLSPCVLKNNYMATKEGDFVGVSWMYLDPSLQAAYYAYEAMLKSPYVKRFTYSNVLSSSGQQHHQ